MELKFEPLDDFDEECIMTLEDWTSCVETNFFIDYDGYGHFATATHKSNVVVCPSDFANKRVIPPDWATHVVWYNK